MFILRVRRFVRGKTLILVITLALISLAILLWSVKKTPDDWPAVKQMVRSSFPVVRQMSTGELAHLISNDGPYKPLLLDARTGEEYAVSHLGGARPAASVEQALQALDDVGKDQLIVVYCSVGYRSSSLAEKLISHGFSNVHNLEGSIFEWANQGRSVYRGNGPVKQVHPYDSTWGGLLDRELWCYSAPEPDR